MTAWVVIGTTPQYGFYAGPSKPSSNLPDISCPTLSNVGALRRPLAISGGEASNISIDIDNGDGALTSLVADWLFLPAVVYYLDGSTEKTALNGTVQSIEIAETIGITIVG